MYQKMVDYLEAAIISGHLKPGSRLPTLRRLCAQFSLSMGTVQRGLAVLETRGLVEGRRGSGVYVRESLRERSTEGARIAVLAESADMEVSYCAHALRGVQEVAEANNCALTLYFVRANNLLEKLQTASASADLLLILGAYDGQIAELIPNLPAVGLEIHRNYNGNMSTVSMDPVRTAELAGEYFRTRNIRRVLVFTQNIPCHRFRCDIFESLWRDSGGECRRFIEPFYASCAMPPLEPDEGILFSSGTYQQRLAVHYREQTGRELRNDFALLSIDGKSLLVPGYLPVSTITTDWVEAGRMTMQEGLRRLRCPGSPARRLYAGVYPCYL